MGSYTLVVAPMGVKFGVEEGTCGPLHHAKFQPHRCNVSPLRAEKPQNRPLSKLNTGRLALRAMLPVKMETVSITKLLHKWQDSYTYRIANVGALIPTHSPSLITVKFGIQNCIYCMLFPAKFYLIGASCRLCRDRTVHLTEFEYFLPIIPN